jgi:hypothetical protein
MKKSCTSNTRCLNNYYLLVVKLLIGLNYFEISDEIVLSQLNNLKSSCSIPPDDIPALFLPKCAHNFYLPLQMLFTGSLLSSRVPDL